MIDRIKHWFAETRAASADDYTTQLLNAQLAAARGFAGLRDTSTFTSCLNLISASASIAEVEGQHSEALQKHLGTITRALVDHGESVWLIEVDAGGRLMLLPATVQNVTGSAAPESWNYSLTQPGPSATMAVYRPGNAVLHFRANVTQEVPWRGRPALASSSGTGALLAALEVQFGSESRMKPTRLMSIGANDTQRLVAEGEIEKGGLVAVSGNKAGDKSPAGALEAGIIRNEVTAAGVNLHKEISAAICSSLGCPPDLIQGGTEAGSRESFRRFAASTITPLLTLIQTEWQEKIGPLSFELDALRAGDIAARGRVLSQRATAFKNLVGAGVEVERALRFAGLSETP